MDKKLFKKCMTFSLSILITCIIAISIYFIYKNIETIGNLIRNIVDIFRPVIYGLIIAFLINPICNFFYKKLMELLVKTKKHTKRNKSRVMFILSLIISFTIVISMIVALFMMIIPQIVQSIPIITANISTAYTNFLTFLKNNQDKYIFTLLQNIFDNSNLTLDINELAQTYISPNLELLLQHLSLTTYNVLLIGKDILIGIIISIYILINKNNLKRQTNMLFMAILNQNIYNIIIDELKFINQVFNRFIIGKCIDSLIIGLITLITLSIFQIPYALVISVIVTITNVVPIFGPIIGAVPGFILVLVTNPIKSLIFLILILIIQQIDGHIIGQKVLSGKIGIPTMWVLISIIIFGHMFGVIGMIIGVPVFTVLYDLIRKFVHKKLKEKQIQESHL